MKICTDVGLFYCSQKLIIVRTKPSVKMEQAALTVLNHLLVSALMDGMASSVSKVFVLSLNFIIF